LRWFDARLLKPSLDWLVRLPNFVVATGFVKQEPSGSCSEPQFRLFPTRRFWVWVAIGTWVSSLVLLPHWLASAAALLIGITWLTVLLRRITATTTNTAALRRGAGDYFNQSPYSARQRGWFVWIPVAAGVSIAAVLTLLWSLPAEFNPGTPREISVWPFLIFQASAAVLALAYWAIHRFRTNTLWLPGLSAWYLKLPQPAQALVRRIAVVPPRYPTQSWRSFPDLSWEVNSAGTAIALFGEQDDRPIWRKSTQYIVWYFAPIVIPLCCLFLTPLIQNAILGPASITDHTKLAYGVNSLTWLIWSVTYFVASGGRDFTIPTANKDAGYPTSLANLLSYPNKELRRVAKEYFDGKGGATFNLLALAVVPLYMGYIGIFPGGSGPSNIPQAGTAETEKSPAVRETTTVLIECTKCCGIPDGPTSAPSAPPAKELQPKGQGVCPGCDKESMAAPQVNCPSSSAGPCAAEKPVQQGATERPTGVTGASGAAPAGTVGQRQAVPSAEPKERVE
jgi:hypothetical protein